jgi:hypothetical protein
MHPHPTVNEELVRARQRDLIREAHNERLMRSVRSPRERESGILFRLVERLTHRQARGAPLPGDG